MSRDRWLFALAAILPLAVYCYTVAPGVTLVDSGEFIASAWTAGIDHPPGTPTYTMLAWLWVHLFALGSIAHRANLFSSVCADFTCGFTYLLIRGLFPGLERWSKTEGNLTICGGHDPIAASTSLAGALSFGFSLSLWHWSAVTEVYALNILLITIFLWFASEGKWIAGCFAAGIALGVHHATVLMALPAAAYLAWIRSEHQKIAPGWRAMQDAPVKEFDPILRLNVVRRQFLQTWRGPSLCTLALSGLAGLAGLSVYLYLPIRAAQHPLMNWGDPSDWTHFWWHITGRQYRFMMAGPPVDYIHSLTVFVKMAAGQFTLLGLAFAVVGFLALWKNGSRQRELWFLSLLIACNVAGTIALNLGGPDLSGYYLPSFLAMAILFAVGCGEIIIFLRLVSRYFFRPALGLMVAGLCGIPMANFRESNHHIDRIAPLFVQNGLRSVPAGSLILTGDWNWYAPWWAMRNTGELDSDVAVVNTAMLRLSWYFPILERQYPALMRAAEPELSDYRARLIAWEYGDKPTDAAFDRSYSALIARFIHIKMDAGASVFFTIRVDRNFLPESIPVSSHGIMYRYGAFPADVPLDLSGFHGDVPQDESTEFVRQDYELALRLQGNFLAQAREDQEAREKFALADSIRGPRARFSPPVVGKPIVYSLNDYQRQKMDELVRKQNGHVSKAQADAIATDYGPEK